MQLLGLELTVSINFGVTVLGSAILDFDPPLNHLALNDMLVFQTRNKTCPRGSGWPA